MSPNQLLSADAHFLLIHPIETGELPKDYEKINPSAGIKNIACEYSLYLRTARLISWRQDAIRDKKTPSDIRSLESNVKWPYGRVLPPVSEKNPLGIPEYFSHLKENEELTDQYIDMFLNDFFHRHDNNSSINNNHWVLQHLMQAKRETHTQYYYEEFKRHKELRLAELNGHLDDLTKQNAFYEIDTHFVGMAPVKNAVWKLYQSDRFSAKEKLSKASLSMHMAFVGTRGKGKTTVVPAVASALKNLGLLKTDNVTSISLNKIAGTTLGADDVALREAFEEGRHGVVFVDEVDVLAGYMAKGHNRPQLSQAINEKMEELRSDTCVIVATYPEHIDFFLDSDQGLRSRFGDRVIHFANYSTEDLVKMFEIEMNKTQFRVENDRVRHRLWEHVSDIRKNHHKDFADGRTIREFIQSLQSVLQDRLSQNGQGGVYQNKPTTGQWITVADIENTIKSMASKNAAEKINAHAERNPFDNSTPLLTAPRQDGTDNIVQLRPNRANAGQPKPER